MALGLDFPWFPFAPQKSRAPITSSGNLATPIIEGISKPTTLTSSGNVKTEPTEGVSKPTTLTSSEIVKTGPTEGVSKPTTLTSSEIVKTEPTEGISKPATVSTGFVKATPGEIARVDKTHGIKPPAPAPVVDELADLQKMMGDWSKGKVTDPVFSRSLNTAVMNLGLTNQAQLGDLEQQIANDPNLQGKGLGYSMLAAMGRNQGLAVSDMVTRLSTESLNRLLDMQKYGIEEFQSIGTERRKRALEGAKTALASGKYAVAAKGLSDIISKDMGYQVDISADELASRDPVAIELFQNNLADMKALAVNDPQAALAWIEMKMADPATAAMFPDGASPQAILDSWVNQARIGGLAINDQLQTEINTAAQYGNWEDAEGYYATMESTGLRDFVKAGKNLKIDRINEVRRAIYGDSAPAYTLDRFGQLVDDRGELLDDEDRRELGKMADFVGRTEKTDTATWFNQIRDTVVPFLGEELLADPQVSDAINDIILNNFDPSSITIDENGNPSVTGDFSSFNITKDPMYNHLFYEWPKAVFDEKGYVTDKESVFEGLIPNSLKDAKRGVAESVEDDNLDEQYIQYRNSVPKGTAVSPWDWYFGTGGGKYDYDANRLRAYQSMTGKELTYGAGESVPTEEMPTPPPTTYTTYTPPATLTEGLNKPTTIPATLTEGLNKPTTIKSGIIKATPAETIKVDWDNALAKLNMQTPVSGDVGQPNVDGVFNYIDAHADKLGKYAYIDEFRDLLAERYDIYKNNPNQDYNQKSATRIFNSMNDTLKKINPNIDLSLYVAQRAGATKADSYYTYSFAKAMPPDLGRAAEIFTTLAELYPINEAYIMASNLIGADKVDAAIKAYSGGTFKEIVGD